MKKLLINFVYYRPVGHVVEALKYARGYYTRNKNIEIHLLLNADSPIEIAKSCKWIKLIKTQSIFQMLFAARISRGYTQAQDSTPIKLWLEICKELEKKIPNLIIYFIGTTETKKGRTVTDDFTIKDINTLVSQLSTAENCFNIGLWNQLALVRKCDIFVSPHTGFAFLAPCVGTPWLALSGCPWSEYVFNDTPFYSVLPDCGYYPSQGEIKRGCGKLLWHGKKSLCMQDVALRKKNPEIVRGVKLLLDPKFTYQKAALLHLRNLKKKRIQNAYFLDGTAGLMRK